MRTLFGTDGIRGRANQYPITAELALRLGRAAAHVLRKEGGRNMVLIGKDTRLSGYLLEHALTAGFCSMGMHVVLVGPVPTPGIALLTRSMRSDLGVVISASHNPYYDNGIKFFSHDGLKLPDQVEKRIEDVLLNDEHDTVRPTGRDIGKASRIPDAVGRYIEFIKSTFPRGMTLEGMKVVVDCANGAAYKVTPLVLNELGADVISVNDKPDGFNINENCGTLRPEGLAEAVRDHGAQVGIAHDGDADRTLFCDEHGRVVDGDQIMGLCAVHLKGAGRLRGDAVVATVMSNVGLEHFLKKHGIELLRTQVGDRYVVERMLADGCNFGGEQSGHIVFMDHNTTGDGPVTALQVLAVMQETGKSLSQLVEPVVLYPQVLINVPVEEKAPVDLFPVVTAAIQKAEESLDGGRVLVRPSGTEPKMRVMIEGQDPERIRELADDIARTITGAMGKPAG